MPLFSRVLFRDEGMVGSFRVEESSKSCFGAKGEASLKNISNHHQI